MKRTLAVSAAAICLVSTSAMAGPTVMSEKEMDSQVAGANVVTRNGNNIWTTTSLDPLEGSNNGGKGNTAVTAPGLLKAVGAGGLNVTGL